MFVIHKCKSGPMPASYFVEFIPTPLGDITSSWSSIEPKAKLFGTRYGAAQYVRSLKKMGFEMKLSIRKANYDSRLRCQNCSSLTYEGLDYCLDCGHLV
jgi:hypothetical protein